MPAYRAYLIDKEGHISQALKLFDAGDDETAIKQAQQFVDGCDVEVWERDRIIALIGSDGVKQKP